MFLLWCLFLPPWRWQLLAPTGAITTALPNPSAKTSSRGLRQCCLRLVLAYSRGGASSIILTHLVRFCLFHFSAALLLYPFCPACIDNQRAPLLSHFPSPLSLLLWHHNCIAFALPVLVQHHCPLALASLMPSSYLHHSHRHCLCNMPILLPLLPTYVPCIKHVLSRHPRWCWC